MVVFVVKIGVIFQQVVQTPPLRSSHLYKKDAECAEWNIKSYFRFWVIGRQRPTHSATIFFPKVAKLTRAIGIELTMIFHTNYLLWAILSFWDVVDFVFFPPGLSTSFLDPACFRIEDPSRNRSASTAYFTIISSTILGGLLYGAFIRVAFVRGLLTGCHIHISFLHNTRIYNMYNIVYSLYCILYIYNVYTIFHNPVSSLLMVSCRCLIVCVLYPLEIFYIISEIFLGQ